MCEVMCNILYMCQLYCIPSGKIKVAIYNHQVDNSFYLRPDITSDLQAMTKRVAVHDAE